uniref:C2H2-type domain-containing protein n=1 Tax=Trichogramma kaykai TaxID=54128 RepID=A0ABD2WT03_9HYME
MEEEKFVKAASERLDSCYYCEIYIGAVHSSDRVRAVHKARGYSEQEPNDAWIDADNGYNFDLVDSCEVKKFETLPFDELPTKHENEAMTLQENVDQEIFINLECNGVEPELTFLSKSICESGRTHFSAIVKKENENSTSYMIEKGQLNVNSCSEIYECENRKSFKEIVEKKSPHELKILPETYTAYESIKMHSNTILRPNECDIFLKSFGRKANLKTHIYTLHNQNKPYQCEICRKSFGKKSTLKTHIHAVHKQSKPFELHNRSKSFECEICHKSFGYRNVLKNHTNAVHDRNKPFECEICHNSFRLKHHLKNHINAIHNRNKSLECEICHKSFGQKSALKRHSNSVHDLSKFECEICHKSYSDKSNLHKHKKTVHNSIKSFVFEEKRNFKRHVITVHDRS